MAKYSVLFNPKANNSKGKEIAEGVIKFYEGDELDFVDITQIGSYKDFFKTFSGDAVILVGGDGTINYLVNDMEGDKIPVDLYLYGGGTGNDFLTDLGIAGGSAPVKINEYLDNLPTVYVNGMIKKFINGIGYCIDGYCCEVADQLKAKSDKPINYTGIAIKGLLFHYKPTNAVITVDGTEYNFKKVWLAPTMHGRFYGGGMMAAPAQDRKNEEGTLTVMTFHGKGRILTLMAFPSIFKGEHVKKKMVDTIVGKEITVKFDRPVALQIDGETVLNVSEYTVKSGK